VLASLHEGLRVASVLLCPYIPVAAETVLRHAGVPDQTFGAAAFAVTGRGATVEAIAPLFPKKPLPAPA
jgi:methionyl-tRNA synthetase